MAIFTQFTEKKTAFQGVSGGTHPRHITSSSGLARCPLTLSSKSYQMSYFEAKQ